MADSFRMDMSGDKSYREDALNRAMDVFAENTRSAAVVAACEHAYRDRTAKERAISHLARNADPEIVQEVIGLLSTPQLPIGVEISLESDFESPGVEVRTGFH